MFKAIVIFLIFSLLSYGQTFSLGPESLLFIESSSSVSFDGLELAPNNSHLISGPNTIDRSLVPVVVGDNSSINRVYAISSAITNYQGVVTFLYKDSELYEIEESSLVLEFLSADGIWINVTPIIDYMKNTLTYNLTDFTAVTASDGSATLTVIPIEQNPSVSVYPNPTSGVLYVVSGEPQHATLFSITGQKILETKATELNFEILPSGVYLLHLQNSKKQISTFKILRE
ncbi:T9SS type A sorting domain-containing protein [Flavobacteriaceae bacterium]|nr:T9SS type A sorting domain-containing protein [Flavobacteriaceae bacterium]MDB4325245.1 T9SS type A sorting domain-containing protein [Flavobacteriaceae bacterium]